MGRPWATLLKAGFRWSCGTAPRARRFSGGRRRRLAALPRSAGRRRYHHIVSDAPALEEVSGVPLETPTTNPRRFAALKKRRDLYGSSTVSPRRSKKLQTRKGRRLRSWMRPSPEHLGAEKGQLLFMIGGESDTLEAARPVLSAMGQKLFHSDQTVLGKPSSWPEFVLACKWTLSPKRWPWSPAQASQEKNWLKSLQASMARSRRPGRKSPVMRVALPAQLPAAPMPQS